MHGFKIDRGEQGEMPASLQNELSILTAKAAYDATSDVLGSEGFTFARNVWDRARKYVGVWNGDSDSDLAGMSDSLKQLLRLGAIMYSMVAPQTPEDMAAVRMRKRSPDGWHSARTRR
jgi:alpha-glucosidase (family GH31 glycosyl hydrolase)